MKTRLTELLGIEFPIIQAPMAGVSTPALAAAVSNAGGLGSIAAGAVDAAGTSQMMQDVKALTDKPWHVNFFAHETPGRDAGQETAWIEILSPVFEELGAAPPDKLEEGYKSFLDDAAMLEAVLEARPPVASFHFGLPHAEQIKAMRDCNVILLASATNVEEALACERAGMDAIIVQGVEAGGHRGVHTGRKDQQIGLFALLPQVADAVSVPVIAAGGIADGRGVAAALALGADGVQMGTAFICCPESSAAPRHRELLGSANARDTVLTRGVSGRAARGLRNRLLDIAQENEKDAPAYPVAYDAAKALVKAASEKRREGFEVMWAGEAGALSKALPAAELMNVLTAEMQSRIGELNDLTKTGINAS